MAGSKRSLRASSVASRKERSKSPSSEHKSSSSKKMKNTAAAAAGRRGRRSDDDDDIDHVKKSLCLDKKPPPGEEEDDEEIMSAASLDDNDNSSTSEDSNNKKVPRAKKEEDDSKPPPAPQPPPAKIKGRFMEVKMKQLTSYFGYTSSSSGGGTKKSSPPAEIKSKNGGGEEDSNKSKRSKWNKRPLTPSGAKAETEENNSVKKRRVNSDENDNNKSEDGGISSKSEDDKSEDDEKADSTQDPDTPTKQPIGSTKDVVGESSVVESSTAITSGGAAVAACPLHFLADAIIMSPDGKNKAGNKINNGKEEVATMPKIISDFADDADDTSEMKDGERDELKKIADDTVDTSIGESNNEAEGRESVNTTKCLDTMPETDAGGEGGFDEGIPSQDQSPQDYALSKEIDEGESSTPALDDDVEMEIGSKTADTKMMTETALDEGDAAAMEVDEMMETTPKEQPSQHADDSTNAIINNYAPLPQASDDTTDTSTHPRSSNNNFEETNTTKASATVSQLKMALFMEASRIHAGSGEPERLFAKYWEALETYILASSHSHSHLVTTRSDPTLQFNAILGIFLKSRKMKRLHNKLILALISDSMRESVPVQHCTGSEYIPRVWRNRTRHLQQCKSEDDGVEIDDSGSVDGLRENWNTLFGNNADTWSACGNNGVTIAPRIDQTEFVAKKRDEEEEEFIGDDNNIIPSCRLPGALGTDLFVKKIASDAGLTVSHDSMWLLIVAAREYASSIIRKAINNDRYVSSGQTSRILKSDYLSLSCEHLLTDKKKGKKKDTKKKELASKAAADKSQGTSKSNESDKKRKVLNCADISQVLQDEQHVAAPRLAWMRSLGRGVTHHQPDLQTTNDMINASIQRAAIERRRTVDRKNVAEALDGNVVPVAAAVEENLHDKSVVINERLGRGVGKEEAGRRVEDAVEKRPSINMNDAATKAPPKSSDLLKSNVPTTEPTTKSSATPSQSGLSQSVDSTAPATATETVAQIKQVSRFAGKNLAAMKARRRSGSVDKIRREPEPTTAKEETPERLVRYQGHSTGPATQSMSQQPAPVSVTNPAPALTPTSTNQSKEETPEKLALYQSQSARLATQSLPQQITHSPAPASVANLSTPAPITINQSKKETPEGLVRFQNQSNGPVNQSVLQQTAPAPVSVTNPATAPTPTSTNQSKEETPEILVHYQSQAAGPATHSLPQQTTAPKPTTVSVTNLSVPAPTTIYQSKDTEKLARYQQAAGPVTENPIQQLAPAPPSVPNQSAGLEEGGKFIQSQFRQQKYKSHATSNTTQLWQETEMTMQSQVDQDEEEEVLPQPKLARTANQL